MMTADFQPSNDVLTSVLRVLERIEVKLEKQEQRVKSLEKEAKDEPDSLYSVKRFNGRTRARSLFEKTSTVDLSLPSTVPYSIWRLGHPKPHQILDVPFMKVIEDLIGDYWKIPDDGRLPLKSFTLTSDSPIDGGDQPTSYSRAMRQIEKDSRELGRFDTALKIQPGNDFLVVDLDSKNNARLYRVGDKAIGSQLRVEYGHSHHAPWSRLM